MAANDCKILILDESESNILFFEMLLKDMEQTFKVYTATAGSHAELLVNEEKINFVICAWEMNAMPGTVFIQRIRQNKSRRHISCVIFSKRMSEQDIALTKDLGFENILGMPFNKETAKALIKDMIEKEIHISAEEKKLRKIEGMIVEGKLSEALKMFDNKLMKHNQLKFRVKANLADIWLQTRHFEKAETILNELLEEDPENVQGNRLIARLYSLTDRHEKAIGTLEQMCAKSPKNMGTMLNLGSAYVEADQHDKAREMFDKVEAMDNENSQLNDEKGKLAFKEGDVSLAAQLLAETQAGEELARHFNNMAIAKVAGEKYDEGIQTYNNAISLLSDKAKLHLLHFNLALAWKKKGDLEKSFKSFCESYLIDPSFEKSYAGLAKVSKDIKAAGKTLDSDLVNAVKAARQKYKEENE